MSVIFYSLAGEGMGHATRGEVLIKWLTEQDYKVVVFTYDRAFFYLKNAFRKNKKVLEVVEITGFNAIYEKNELKFRKTLLNESKKLRKILSENLIVITEKILKYSPSISIVDFESTLYSISKLLKIPIICIDNQGFMSKCRLDKPLSDSLQVKFFDYSHIYDGDYNFITSVFRAPIKEHYKNKTYLAGPIIRNIFDNKKTKIKNHFLVYQTSKSNEDLIDFMEKTHETFIVYGFDKEEKQGNVTFKKMNTDSFVEDFMSCKGVITNGGYTLISEAIYLKKPIYSIPVKKITEQSVNGYYLQKAGFGIYSEEINPEDFMKFKSNLKSYRKNLEKNTVAKNDILKMLKHKIEELESTNAKFSRTKTLSKLLDNYEMIMGKIKKLRGWGKSIQ